MTTFKRGDRVTSTNTKHLPEWEDLIYVGFKNDLHFAVKASNGARGGFYEGVLKHIEASLDTSKPLQTVDGKRVSFIGKMEDGRIVVSVTYSSWGQGPATELRFADGRKSSRPGETSGDDVIVKITEKVVFQNVYADGTTGATQHASAEAAAQRSKYGKVRIGILKTTLRDGVRFSAVLTPATVPWYRDASVSSGRAATPEDFAR